MRKKLILVLVFLCILCCSCDAMLYGLNNSNSNNNQAESNTVSMPNLVGMMLPEANETLENLGIKDITVNTNNDEFVIDDSNWIVFSQGTDAGNIIANGNKVVLTVGRVSDFVGEYFRGKSLKEIYEFSVDQNFTIAYTDEETGGAVQFQQNDDNLENWTITKYESVSKNMNSAKVWLRYSGSVIVPSVNGMILSEAKEILAKAHILNVDVESESDESIWNYSAWKVIEQSVPENETIDTSKAITLKVEKYEASSPTSTQEKILDEKFPKEMAYRAVVTAITNYYALDVLTNGEVDVKKFHSYSDKSENKDDYYLTVLSDGVWTINVDDTWHVEGMKLYKAGGVLFYEVTANIRQNESGYEIYNVIDADDTTSSNTVTYPDTDKAFLVKEELVKDDRQPDPIPTHPIIEFKNIKCGDTVKFGKWVYSDIDAIEWVVLSVEEDRALLLSKYIITSKKFIDHTGEQRYTWETSDLRKWLNGDFYYEAFDLVEKNTILSTNLSTPINPLNGSSGGDDTADNVFILTVQDMCNPDYGFDPDYKKSDEKRRGIAVKYAANKLADYNKNKENGKTYASYWLRSAGEDEVKSHYHGRNHRPTHTYYSRCTKVTYYGGIYDKVDENEYLGVRPALYIKIR